MSRDPVLIFAGGKGVGKRTLLGRMLGERSHPLPTVVAASPDLWQLQTKYFEAKIVAKVVAEPSSLETQGIESSLCEVIVAFDICGALLLRPLLSIRPDFLQFLTT
jgi:hypothetical protein